MWIQVRSMDGRKSIRLDGLSKLSKIEDIRELLVEDFDAPPERQRLFYRGKQLVDGHSLFDYSVGLNEIIQIMVRAPMPVDIIKDSEETDSTNKENEEPNKEQPKTSSGSVSDTQDSGFNDELNNIYKVGDIIDCRDETMGAWFEAKIQSVKSKKKTVNSGIKEQDKTDSNANVVDKEEAKSASTLCPWDTEFVQEDDCLYKVIYEGYEEDDPIEVTAFHLRPRARHIIKFTDCQVGAKVMVNYNYDEPTERGYWYDGVVTEKRNTRTIKEVYCTVFIGKDLVPFEKCLIPRRDEIFEIEQPGTQINIDDPEAGAQSPVKRTNKPNCDFCKDNPKKKCKECACHMCGGKNEPDKTLLCDECDMAYHLFCLDPPLESIPDVDEWYCPLCKNDATEVVQAGEKLKASKKKAKMASNVNQSSRDWGRGMACVGRSKICSLVPTNHVGPIPGVPVGSLWRFRVGVSESGVHRPHVAGIAGRENEGAYSIVLSGGYEDDVDDGDEFLYTGSGGRDLSGNKRTAEQSCDQTLTRMNLALAKCCNCQVNSKTGGDAGEKWKGGKPIRVVRNCKGAKHSEYAPEEGNRYDGIYKMVKYWPDKGQSGFLVWRYKLRRDDPTPAPWTKEGKKLIKQLGIEMVYPDGWLEAQAEKERKKTEDTNEKGTPKGGKGKGKRKRIESDEEEDAGAGADSSTDSPVKKKAAYALEEEVEKLIKSDTMNAKLWEEALKSKKDGAQKFVATVEETFSCICCQDIVFKPITTPCFHNVCKSCLSRSFKAGVYTCPACRHELGEDYKMETNSNLFSALKQLFPGYVNGRD